jgi:hypothetical protein
MTGKIIRKDNAFWIKSGGRELPISTASLYYKGFGIKEGKEVEFEIEREIYTDETGELTLEWAVLKPTVNRLEIISKSKGRLHTYRGDIDVQFQDGDRTIKIFIE